MRPADNTRVWRKTARTRPARRDPRPNRYPVRTARQWAKVAPPAPVAADTGGMNSLVPS